MHVPNEDRQVDYEKIDVYAKENSSDWFTHLTCMMCPDKKEDNRRYIGLCISRGMRKKGLGSERAEWGNEIRRSP